jgi:glycosyltransferase involved in cell wall biosynthesis
MESPQPKLSVVIPAHNRETLIARSIRSALACGVSRLEVIVVDDGSTDRTADVIRSFGAPVRYVGQRNAGVSAARNTGAALASGTFIAFLDSDDQWLGAAPARLVDTLDAYPQIAAVLGDARIFFERTGDLASCFEFLGHGTADIRAMPLEPGLIRPERDGLLEKLLGRNLFQVGGSVIRREAFAAVGGFNTRMSHAEDWEFFIKLAARCDVAIDLRGPVVQYHVHEDPRRLSSDTDRFEQSFCAALEWVERDVVLGPGPAAALRRHLARHRWNLGYQALQRGDHREARARFLKLSLDGGPRERVSSLLYFLAAHLPSSLVKMARDVRRRDGTAQVDRRQ